MQGNRQNGKMRGRDGWVGAQFRALQQHGVSLRSARFRISSLSNRNPLQNILILKNRDIEKKCFVATKHKKYLGYYRIIMIIVVVVVVDAVIPIFIGFINYYRCFCPLLTV